MENAYSAEEVRPPRPPEPRWEHFPEALTRQPRWVLWRYELRGGKWTKPPLQPDGSYASSTNPATWAPFDFVQTAYLSEAGFDGVGFVLDGSGLTGWDFDHVVRPDGTIADAKIIKYVQMLDSYSEISPSGTGLRGLVYGRLPEQDRKIGGIECYDSERYITITGHHFPSTPRSINHRQDAINAVHAEVFAERIKQRAAQAHTNGTARPANNLDDAALLEKARRATNGAKFSALYDRGDWSSQGYKSQSEADLWLCGALAFWTGGDLARIDALFRLSALYRTDKWVRPVYRENTLSKALAGRTEFYDPDRHAKGNGRAFHNSTEEAGAEPAAEAPSESQSPTPPSITEDGLALQFVDQHGRQLLYVERWNRWLHYEKGVWRPDDTLAVYDTVRRLCRGVADALKKKEAAVELRRAKTVAAVERLARSDRRVAASVDQFDENPWVLNTPGGAVDFTYGPAAPT